MQSTSSAVGPQDDLADVAAFVHADMGGWGFGDVEHRVDHSLDDSRFGKCKGGGGVCSLVVVMGALSGNDRAAAAFAAEPN